MKLIFFIFALMPSVSALASNYEYRNDDFQLRLVQKTDEQIVFFQGELRYFTDVQGISQLQRKLELSKPIRLIIYRSNGGYVEHYNKFARALKSVCAYSISKSCTLTTEVTSRCASACVDLFMQGDLRLANSSASFGFHRMWIFRRDWVIQKSENNLIQLGANEAWVRSRQNIFVDDQIHGTWLKATELEGSNIVHQIIP